MNNNLTDLLTHLEQLFQIKDIDYSYENREFQDYSSDRMYNQRLIFALKAAILQRDAYLEAYYYSDNAREKYKNEANERIVEILKEGR